MAPPTLTGNPHASGQQGIALVGALVLVAVLGLGMALLGTVWKTAAVREKEAELLFVGDQFRLAIESFQDAPAGGVSRLPKSFQELLLDTRFPNTVRHLRRIYRDPMTGSSEWGLILGADGGISGVYSLAPGAPLKTGNFSARHENFTGAKSYEDWRFEVSETPELRN